MLGRLLALTQAKVDRRAGPLAPARPVQVIASVLRSFSQPARIMLSGLDRLGSTSLMKPHVRPCYEVFDLAARHIDDVAFLEEDAEAYVAVRRSLEFRWQ